MIRESIQFPNGRTAEAIHVGKATSAKEIVEEMRAPAPEGVICLNGGTAKLAEALKRRLTDLLVDGLARVVCERLYTVLTGGTDAGIFALLGQGIQKWHTRLPVVLGVAPEGCVNWPTGGHGDTPLEPNHTHFVLVPGREWGDETSTMYALAAEWSRTSSSLAIFAGGGAITLNEMKANMKAGRQMILIEGSGRSTDAVLQARAGKGNHSEIVREIASRGRIDVLSIRAEPDVFAEMIRSYLSPRSK